MTGARRTSTANEAGGAVPEAGPSKEPRIPSEVRWLEIFVRETAPIDGSLSSYTARYV